jgi:hypothetical protein
VRVLKKRLFLRFHMSLILIGTALVGGGGASGSFEVGGADEGQGAIAKSLECAGAGDGIGKAAGEAAGDAASGIVEKAGLLLVILGILLAIVFGAGLYLVYDAPFILTEAAFDFVLSASLIKSARKLDGPDWTGSVLRTTWKPFLVALGIALIGAAVIHSRYPEAHKLSEIFR